MACMMRVHFDLELGERVQGHILRQLGASTEGVELNGHMDLNGDGTKFGNELASASGSATGGEEIVHNQNTHSLLHRLFLDLNRRGTILQRIGHLLHCAWQLTSLASGDEGQAKGISQRNTKVVATRVQTDNSVQLVLCSERIHQEEEVVRLLLMR